MHFPAEKHAMREKCGLLFAKSAYFPQGIKGFLHRL